jgi:hypothetical protein
VERSRILPGISTRALIFGLSLVSVPILLKSMGVVKYSEYIFVLAIVNLCYLFELGNSNNLVELPVKNMTGKIHRQLLDKYMRRALNFAGLAGVASIIYLIAESYFELGSQGIQLSKEMQFSILVGVFGVGIGFQANVFSKFGIALGKYKYVMNLLAFSNGISVLFLIFASYFNAQLWICIFLQIAFQQLIIITTLRRKFLPIDREDMPIQNEIASVTIPTPHILFKFYAVFTPIYGTIVLLLFSRQGDEIVFSAASTFYRISSIPLVFASFAWINLLWIEIGKTRNLNSGFQARSYVMKRFILSGIIVSPFFLVIGLFGQSILKFWTGEALQISHQMVMQFTFLGFIQFIGVVPSAVTLVYRRTKLIFATHILYLIFIIIVFTLPDISKNPFSIVPVLIYLEIAIILLPNLHWVIFRLPLVHSKLKVSE